MATPTLKSIAKATGFSVTTVSRALGGYDDVNEDTRRIILEEAQRQGYEPNFIARQLQGRRTYTIGMVIPASVRSTLDDFFSVLIKGVSYSAAKHHYDLLISAQIHGTNEMDAYRRIVGGNRVDGVIVARTYQIDPRIDYLKTINHPFVVSGRSAPDKESDFPYIDVDSRAGIRMLVQHFVEYGHEHIGLILPPAEIAYTPYRLAGYQDGLAAVGIPFRTEYTVNSDLMYQGGCDATTELLERAPQISALIACNDLMALGAMSAIRERGLQVGEDIAVGGFDNIPAAEHANLTTVSQPIYQIGEQLTDKLLRLIAGDVLEDYGTLLIPELVIRESSGHPRR